MIQTTFKIAYDIKANYKQNKKPSKLLAISKQTTNKTNYHQNKLQTKQFTVKTNYNQNNSQSKQLTIKTTYYNQNKLASKMHTA